MPPIKVVAISVAAAVENRQFSHCESVWLAVPNHSSTKLKIQKWNENGSDVRHSISGSSFVIQTLFYSLKSKWCRHVCALCLWHGFLHMSKIFNKVSDWNYWRLLLIKCMCYVSFEVTIISAIAWRGEQQHHQPQNHVRPMTNYAFMQQKQTGHPQ